MIAFLAFVFPLALYISFPSSFWNFDGVACAAALELGQPSYLFHANHLVYGWLGFLFWKFMGLPMGLSRALPALQLFTSLLACLGLLGVYRLLAGVLENKVSALLLTSSLAFTAAFWVWSIEAQVYTLGFFALAWATYYLIHSENPNKYTGVGILHGAAVLGHVIHFLWALPALYWIFEECESLRRSKSKALLQYSVSLGLVTLIPYLIVLTRVIAPGRQFTQILIWLKGSAGLTADRHWAWHSSGWTGPWIYVKSTAPALWGIFWPYGKTIITPWMWALTFVSMAVFLVCLMRGWKSRSEPLARFSWLWMGIYGLFLSTWEAGTLCYRLQEILPIGLLLALGLKTWRASIQIILVSVLLVSTLTLNFFTRAYPMHDAAQNHFYQDTLTLSKMTPANSLYITEGGLSWMYLLYFTGRTAWNARAYEPQKLAEEINRQKRIRSVYVQKGTSWQIVH